MHSHWLEAYVLALAVLIPATFLAGLAVAGARAGLPISRLMRAIAVLGGMFALWLALAHWATTQGYVMPPATLMEPPWVLVLLFGGASAIILALNATDTGRSIMVHIDQRFLIGMQIFRVMGGVFLLLWLLGEMPWQFALPAGVGDVAAGIAAYGAWRAIERGDIDARDRVVRANWIGLADFAIAVTLGLLTTPGFAHLLAHHNPNIINAYPLGLFPAFFVAIFIAIHVLSLQTVARDRDLPALPAAA